MPSTVIHLCIAKKINEKFKLNEQLLFLGSIAPDVSKYGNLSKKETHYSNPELPNELLLKNFYNKYQEVIYNPFTMGYFIHLIADDLWSKYINAKSNSLIDNKITKLLYTDYYSLNHKLIDEYKIDLSKLKNYDCHSLEIIDDFSFDQLPSLIENTYKTIDNSQEQNPKIINFDDVKKFITDCSNIILKNFIY